MTWSKISSNYRYESSGRAFILQTDVPHRTENQMLKIKSILFSGFATNFTDHNSKCIHLTTDDKPCFNDFYHLQILVAPAMEEGVDFPGPMRTATERTSKLIHSLTEGL